MRLNRISALLIGFACAASASFPAFGVPYASGVRNTNGTNWEFILNEAADVVTITPNTGAPIVINNAAVGRHMIDLMGATSFDIAVSKAAAEEWTELSDPANLFSRFERPVGLAINKDPSSPFFGTIYVGQSTNLSTAAAGAIPARTMAEGVYPLTADQIGVDLSTFAAVTDPQATSQSKRPGNWVTDDTPGSTGTGASNDNARSPYRITLDTAGNLIVADWSTTAGGIKWASPDLSAGGPLLAIQDGEEATFAVRNSNSDDLHSRIPSAPYVTGSLGNDLTLTAIDALLEAVVEVSPTPVDLSDRLNIWRWNVGDHDFTANPNGYDGTDMPAQSDFIVPDMIIRGQQLNRVHGPAQSQSTGTQWFNSVPGVQVDMYYSPQHDLYYLTQPRSNGDQPSLLIVDANLDEDPTGQTPIVLFNSREWTRDHGMDGAIGVAALGGVAPESGRDGEDIFRMAGTVEISADGSTMYLRRQQLIHITSAASQNENPVLGGASNNPFGVLAIPLDEEGLPVIEIDDMGTPADTTDDRISNFGGFQIANQTSNAGAHEIELDAAGNVYVTNSISERLQVFTPGGSWTAITTSDGMFSLVPFVPPVDGVAGDYNDDGTVDSADYVIFRKLLGTNNQLPNEGEGVTPGMVTPEDYDTWRTNFGQSSAPGLGSNSAVPEPGTIALALLAIAALGACRRRTA